MAQIRLFLPSLLLLIISICHLAAGEAFEYELERRQSLTFGTGDRLGDSTSDGFFPTGVTSPVDVTTTPTTDPTTPPTGVTTPTFPDTTTSIPPTPTDTGLPDGNATTTSPSEFPSVTATTTNSTSATSETESIKTFTSALKTTSQSKYIVRTTVIVDGSTSVGAFTTSKAVTLTTGFVTATNPAQLAAPDDSDSGSMSDSTKKIIGGVVGGVGGAILLGGILFVAWRLRRKDPVEEDDYGYKSMDEYGQDSKRLSQGSTQALSNGLERYHSPGRAPAMAVNTSSNF